MMKFRENEEAVSPVIGVILMVAITVILAAVIAAFVFGMTGNVQGTKVVSISSKLVEDGANIELMINGGADLSTLTGLKIKFGEDDATVTEGSITAPYTTGQVITVTNDGGRLIVVGMWGDAEQVLLDKTYTAPDAADP